MKIGGPVRLGPILRSISWLPSRYQRMTAILHNYMGIWKTHANLLLTAWVPVCALEEKAVSANEIGIFEIIVSFYERWFVIGARGC